MRWRDRVNDAIYLLNDPKNELDVVDIFRELDYDLLIEGENSLYNAIMKLEELGERDIAKNFIFPAYKAQQEQE